LATSIDKVPGGERWVHEINVQPLLCRPLDYADHWPRTVSGCGDRCVGVGIIRLIPQVCSLPLAN
jgi:hypothetical protein